LRDSRIGCLADADEGRPQQAIAMHVPWLNDVGHGARWMSRIGCLEACLVAMRVERLADRIEALETMLGEGVEESAPGRLDPGQ
jgi:hypothetical protein